MVNKAYKSPPLVSSSTVLAGGAVLFLLALIWPPLVMLSAWILSRFIPYAFRENDDATRRRVLWKEFQKRPDLPEDFRQIPHDIDLKEEYWVNGRGMCLMTAIMRPKEGGIKAVVCYCHGYTDNASYMRRVEYMRLIRNGIAVVSIEYEGHGRSDGALALVPSWDLLIDDVSSFFESTLKEKFSGIKAFLVGESMGGAISFCTYNRNPSLWSGTVFVAPMCKISDDMLPPPAVVNLLKFLLGENGSPVNATGYLPIAPVKNDLYDIAFHDQEKRDMATKHPTVHGRNPRLATARELLAATTHITSTLDTFEAPFLVLHGKDDRVTDPKLSQSLHDDAKSKDKTIKLYDDMWHNLTIAESDEAMDVVFKDIIDWILERAH